MTSKDDIANTIRDNISVLGMVMLKDNSSFNLDHFVLDYETIYGESILDLNGDNEAAVFSITGKMVAIGHVGAPIPIGDIESTAEYAYNWDTVLEDNKKQTSHLIVSIMNAETDQINCFKVFTKVLCSILRTTKSIGVYKGTQSLLIPADDYLDEAESMSDEHLPLNLWIYFGLRKTEEGNSVYTYGLTEFGKNNMEVVNSSKSPDDLRDFLLNITHYVLGFDVTFAEGQTIGMTENEKIPITFSEGKYVSGHTFKFGY